MYNYAYTVYRVALHLHGLEQLRDGVQRYHLPYRISPENCKGYGGTPKWIFKNTENADQRLDLGVQYIIPKTIEK